MRDIAAVMVTVDRSPKTNYLAETLRNLKRGGLEDSQRLHSLELVNSDSGTFAWRALSEAGLTDAAIEYSHDDIVPANLNVATSLREGAREKRPWVLFLEDDIDVCADFFDSVGAWLDDHAREDRRIYPLAANYEWVQEAAEAGQTAAEYPIDQFYGTQAVALRSEDAADFAEYLAERSGTRVWQTLPDGTRRLAEGGTGYDLILTYWHRKRYPDIDYFLTPCPSFAQHIGLESVILPRDQVHTFPSWPGRHWTYGDPLPAAASAEVVA